MKLYKKLYAYFFPPGYFYIEKQLEDCNSILDLGCGDNSPLQYFHKQRYCVGVDIHRRSIEKTKEKKIHHKYVLGDICSISKTIQEKSFDAVIALDVIEHLKKKDAEKLIDNMLHLARKKVIIFTPNGFLEQEEYNNNPYQKHRSGWTVREMRDKGFIVIGINGFKTLRTIYGKIRYRPEIVWKIISNLSEIFVKHYPEYAFHILCVKKIKQ